MSKNTVVLEISHKFIKLVMGYVQNEQVFITYSKKVPTNHFLENGLIKEKQQLVKELLKMNPIIDEDYQIDELINNVILVLPPYGLEVYQTSQMISVVSEEKVVGELDIKNIYGIIRNKRLPVDNELIDIIPEAFALDNGNLYATSPLGKISSAITAYTKVYTLPKRINQEYSDVLRSSNFQIERKVVSTFASSEIISTYPDIPETYFLVDIGSDSTSVSLIGKKQLFGTRSFSCGGGNITDHIISSFNISEAEAEKIKQLYGLDKRQMRFDFAVSSTETENGVSKHFVSELNQIIESELDEFYKNMNVAIEQLAQLYNVVDYQNLPIILIGGGSKLKGIVTHFVEKGTYPYISTLSPNNLGARDPSLFALIGAIYINSKYSNTNSGEKNNNISVSRED